MVPSWLIETSCEKVTTEPTTYSYTIFFHNFFVALLSAP